MSDWAEDAMLKAFPRDGTTYFLQLVDEPVLREVKGQWGPYTVLTVNLQFFAIDNVGEYHYMGPVTFKGQSCVFEDFTAYTHILLDVCYKVTGYKHGKHVDLEIEKTFDRQHPSRTLNQPASEPHKLRPAAVEQQPLIPPPPAAAGNPCQHFEARLIWADDEHTEKMFQCKDCGERVG
ncbi:unnamed protein product [marine sediment metagenome]|uniref:Uncharacterized protein n=1 Tax=marine sediment metagenome TaxID=412755 RepID=X1B175_9ZZZZ